jgi:asparagine synthase (glutamine-hydrolysing)
MCGLAGFVGAGDENDLRTMIATLVHRGPDGEGYYRDHHAPVFLGHRRLAILDPVGGHQPMWDADGTVGIVFNGEIYNHRSLRKELEALGHHFASDHADTEVLVHGWKVWGNDLFIRLDGMFALAIFDRNAGVLTLARDRFGEKPLYYAARPDAVIFGSELTALLEHPVLKGVSVSKTALQKFFAHGFFPAPRTPYDGVHKLLPGHILSIDAKTLETKSNAYWRFTLGDPEPPSGTEEDWAAELNTLLADAVTSRLEADVPLGLFLSGGIDSSAVLSCAADTLEPSSIRTFAIGFSETSFDESPWAEEMALHVGSTHQVEICDLDAAQGALPSVLTRLDEPLGDPSILPTSLLCVFARKNVTVALSGDGGDELFAGYDPFRILRRAQIYERYVPRPVHSAVRVIAAALPRSDSNMSFDFVLNRGLRGLKHPESEWNARWLGALEPDDIAALFNEPVDAESLYSEAISAWEACPSTHIVDKTLDFYTRFYLPDGILTKTDRASMAVGLEARSPFLANGVADFAQRLPWHTKLRGRTGKWILKQALRDRIPAGILSRQKKGFGIPLARWLKTMDPPSSPIPAVDNTWLRGRWASHKAGHKIGNGDDRLALWCWMALSHGLKP